MEDLIAELKEQAKKKRLEGNRKGAKITNSRLWYDSYQERYDDNSVVTDDTTEETEEEDTKPIHTWDKLSEIAGVSKQTLLRVKKIQEKAPEEIKKIMIIFNTNV